MDIRRILVPTDFSAHANRAVTAAFELAQTFGAKLTVLHVVEPPTYLVDSHASSHQGPLLLKTIEEQAKRELGHLLSQLPDAQVEIARRVVVGVPYRRITESAPTKQVDLIVMAHPWAHRSQAPGPGQCGRARGPPGAVPGLGGRKDLSSVPACLMTVSASIN